MKFSGMTIISDMDGTILSDDKKISIKDREAVKYFTDNGGDFTIASGRIASRIKLYYDQLNITLPVISSNGMIIYDFINDKALSVNELDEKSYEYTRKITEMFPEIGVEIYSGNKLYFIHCNEHIKKHVKDEGFDLKIVPISEAQRPWTKVLFACDFDLLKIIKNKFNHFYEEFDFTKSDHYFYEMLKKGENKGTALEKLCEIKNINLKNVVAIGDNKNDIEFLKCAGTKVAVKNACKEVLELADVVVSDNNNSPIYDYISRL